MLFRKNRAGVLLLPIGNVEVPENRLTDRQYLDMMRVWAGMESLTEAEKGHREKKAKDAFEVDDETVRAYCEE